MKRRHSSHIPFGHAYGAEGGNLTQFPELINQKSRYGSCIVKVQALSLWKIARDTRIGDWHHIVFNACGTAGSGAEDTFNILQRISSSRKGANLQVQLMWVLVSTWQQERALGFWQLKQLPVFCQMRQSNIKQPVRQSLLSDKAMNLSQSIISPTETWHWHRSNTDSFTAWAISLFIVNNMSHVWLTWTSWGWSGFKWLNMELNEGQRKGLGQTQECTVFWLTDSEWMQGSCSRCLELFSTVFLQLWPSQPTVLLFFYLTKCTHAAFKV